MTAASPPPGRRGRPRGPALFGPVALDALVGGTDPALRAEAAHTTAAALVAHGRAAAGVPQEIARLVALADEFGLEEVADLWADRPADTLPGALWRLYALRSGIRRDPDTMARGFAAGRAHAPVDEVVAGVAEPPGPREVEVLADAVLTGAFRGDLAVALERAGAFCRVVATGWAVDGAGVERAAGLARTGDALVGAAGQWRRGTLH